MPPTIDVFVTSILSNPAIRGRHERVKRALTSARVPYAEHDVAGDEAAKSMWKRKNGGKNELPFILVDGEPVGSIEDMDEAVEFGELRQFLRLDSAAPPPPAAAPVASSSTTPSLTSSSTTSSLSPAPAPSASSSSSSSTNAPSTAADETTRPKPTLDDFSSLDLTSDELAELERELARGDTFSSGLGSLSLHDPTRQGYDFSSATQRFEPVFAPTQPLKLEKVDFQRPLPDRPLASEVVRDELESMGISEGEVAEDELEKLARELEEEEMERRRLRDAQPDGRRERGVEPPPLPEKEGDETGEKEPRLPAKDAPLSADSISTATKSPTLANATSIPGDGGAALSAPLGEVDHLRLSPSELSSLHTDLPTSSSLSVASPSSLSPLPAPSSHPAHSAEPEAKKEQKTRTSRKAAALLKSELLKAVSGEADADPERLKAVGGSVRVSELPQFASGVEGKEGEKEVEKEKEEGEELGEEGKDGLADRVAEAIRGGDL